jgi:hypothetical protein
MSFWRRRDASATAKAIHSLSEKSRALASAHGKVSGLVSLVGRPAYPALDRDKKGRVASRKVQT